MKTCQWSSNKLSNGTNSARGKAPFYVSLSVCLSVRVALTLTGSIMGKLGLSRELQAGSCFRIWFTPTTDRKSLNILYQQVNIALWKK